MYASYNYMPTFDDRFPKTPAYPMNDILSLRSRERTSGRNAPYIHLDVFAECLRACPRDVLYDP